MLKPDDIKVAYCSCSWRICRYHQRGVNGEKIHSVQEIQPRLLLWVDHQQLCRPGWLAQQLPPSSTTAKQSPLGHFLTTPSTHFPSLGLAALLLCYVLTILQILLSLSSQVTPWLQTLMCNQVLLISAQPHWAPGVLNSIQHHQALFL